MASARCSRRRFLLGAASAFLVGGLGPRVARAGSAPRTALERAHTWMWNVQAQDGRFASATYGLLASGQSLTPFALDSLLSSPAPLLEGREAAVSNAIRAMSKMRSASGALGFAGPVPDYPCYATGLYLSCLGRARPEGWRDLAAPSIGWLRGQQLRAADGWAGHPAQGGFGMGTEQRLAPPHAGHVDLSMTRRVVEGLRAVGVPADDPALVEVQDFVGRCQTADGSFVYSPVELALNKGLRDREGRPRGYGSATTDGLLCLDALGPDAFGKGGGDRATRALAWLHRSHRVDRNPGLDGGPMEAFAEAMRGYYRAGVARCFASHGGPDGWREGLGAVLVAEQRPDGSFVGTSPLQKEDDPIVATSFAVQALAAIAVPA